MPTTGGWLKLHRSLVEHPLWLSEQFTPGQAWVDLLMMANFHEGNVLRGNRWISIARGEIFTSQTALASRWRWDRKTVRAFLRALSADNMVTIETSKKTDTGYTLITIVNFGRFQGDDGNGLDIRNDFESAIGAVVQSPSNGHPIPTSKNEKKGKNRTTLSGSGSVPAGPSLDQYLATLDTEAQVIVRQTVAAIAATRKGGKVAQTVLDDIARRLARYPLAAVLSGCTIYCTRDYAGQGKREHYLLGIIRNQVAERNGDVPSQPATKTRGQQLIDRAAAVVAEGNGP